MDRSIVCAQTAAHEISHTLVALAPDFSTLTTPTPSQAFSPLATEHAALLPALQRMGLCSPDKEVKFTALTGGVSSLIVKVETADLVFCVKRALPQLKVAALWEAPVRRNRDEVAWLKFARSVAPDSVPQVLGEDEQDCIFAMSFLPADRYTVWKQQLLEGVVNPSMALAMAQLLARLHAASADNLDLCRSFDHDDDFVAIRLSPYFLFTAEKHPDCAEALKRLVTQTLSHKKALIHGDVSPKNILIGSNGPVLLDAECACWGDPAFDLAFVLTHLMLKSVWKPALTDAYLNAFDLLSATYLQSVTWESPAALEARTCDLLAGMLLARVDGKSPVEYLRENWQHALIRHQTIAWLNRPQAKLADMRAQWKTA